MSNTLTVMDAVNSFKGELIFSFEYLCYGKANNEYFAVEDLADINEDEYFICGKMKFKGLVKELETNFGRSYSYQQYKFVFKQMTSESKAKPVFTQAMADAGNMVEAGMLFETEAGQYAAEYTNKKSVCFTDENGFLVTVTRGNAKPIDKRTDKEKAIDLIYDDLYANKVIHSTVRDGRDDDLISSTLSVAYDKWVGK